MITKQGRIALGFCKYNSWMLELRSSLPANESNSSWSSVSSIFSKGICTIPAITLHTIRAFLESTLLLLTILIDAKAFSLLEAVKTPAQSSPLCWSDKNPFLRIWHTPQLSDKQRLDDPLIPSKHSLVVPWNLNSSFPSARQRGCSFDSSLAFCFTFSLYSSNLLIVFCRLWTFRILSISQLKLDFSKLDMHIICTMFLVDSPSTSSVTTCKTQLMLVS